jgi:hypothetical protein
MSKLLSMILAGGAALAIGGTALANDPARDSGRDAQNQTQGAPVEQGDKDVATEGRDPKKEEFQADLKKCDALSGAEKKSCTDAAKKKHGQM